MVSNNCTLNDVVNFIGMFDLPLNRPQVVAHHLLAGFEQAPNANRLEGQLTLGTIIQLIFHQAMGVSVLYQRNEFN